MGRVREASENAAQLSQTLNDQLPQQLNRIEMQIETAATAVLLCCTIVALTSIAIAITVMTKTR
jgi:hypothetical protein